MEQKPFFASLTFWGAIIAVAGPLLGQFGVVIPSEGLAAEIVSVIGGAIAIAGRFMAKKTITLT